MSENSDQSSVISFLSDPHSYGPGIEHVERFETHGSIVFLAGDRAFKLKRAVHFPYMDYSTVERRHEMCLRELAANRRTAPTLYLSVASIVRDEQGLHFGSAAEAGPVVDWTVVMRRFDQGKLFEQMRQSGKLSQAALRDVANVIAEFHRNAEVVGNLGGAAAISDTITQNTQMLRQDIDRPFDRALIDQYSDASLAFHQRVCGLLEERRQQGQVRRCHGDLHLNNICMIDGRPTLFDAIEFNDAFSCIDVLYDLAFLLMDLHRHGLRAYANVVLNRYLELSDQHAGLEALPLFIACRAAVRAHTALAASQAMSDKTSAPELRIQAANLLREAVDVLDVPRPRLVAIGGLSGTGKSTLARDLAPSLGAAPGAIVLRSDVIRKHLMGVAETVRLPQEAYTPNATERVYRRIRELSEICLKAGYSVIADAVYGRAEERDALRRLAEQLVVPFTGLWLVAPPDVLATRLARRLGDASDATAAVMRSQLLVVEPPQTWVSVPASSCASDTLATAQRFLSSPD